MNAQGLYKSEKKTKPIESNRPTLSKEELESVLNCLILDQLGSGAVVHKFEKTFASTFGYKHVLAVNTLSSAYHLAMLALEIRSNDKVVMSALAPVAALDAANYAGATPHLSDVARNSFHPSNESIQTLLSDESGVDATAQTLLILDHTFGTPFDADVTSISKQRVRIIEDFTGLVGCDNEGIYYGTKGDVAVCGLSENDLITTGNGAVIVTSDSKLYNRMLNMRYGARRTAGSICYDYRIEDFQAAMGLDQLTRIGTLLSRRKKIGRKYLETIKTTKHESYFYKPDIDGFLRFPVIINRNHDEVMRYFSSLQIGVTRTHDFPLHHLMGKARLEFPNAERIYQKGVAIPVYPTLTSNNVDRIASSLRGLI